MEISFELNQKKYKLTVPKGIECILLHGSYVYGEYNKKRSDIDFIILINNELKKHKNAYKAYIARKLEIPKDWVVVYTCDEFMYMSKIGNYFFWTVFLHHIILYSRTGYVQHAFSKIQVYNKVKRKMRLNNKKFQNLLYRYKIGRYKQSKLQKKIGHFIRSTCINICYLEGFIEYGKYACVRKCLKMNHVKIPFTLADYKKIFVKKKHLNDSYFFDWYKRYKFLLKQVLVLEKLKMKEGFVSPLQELLPDYKVNNRSPEFF